MPLDLNALQTFDEDELRDRETDALLGKMTRHASEVAHETTAKYAKLLWSQTLAKGAFQLAIVCAIPGALIAARVIPCVSDICQKAAKLTSMSPNTGVGLALLGASALLAAAGLYFVRRGKRLTPVFEREKAEIAAQYAGEKSDLVQEAKLLDGRAYGR